MSKTAKVIKQKFLKIERIWAEHGIVCIEDKEGKRVNLSVRDAAARAQAINNMQIPDWHKKARNELVSAIIETIREAKSQQENPRDKQEAEIINLLNNKTAAGTPLDSVDRMTDARIAECKHKYPYIEERDILAVIERQDLTLAKQEEILREINRQNSPIVLDPLDFTVKPLEVSVKECVTKSEKPDLNN